jgi:hypothetical protein
MTRDDDIDLVLMPAELAQQFKIWISYLFKIELLLQHAGEPGVREEIHRTRDELIDAAIPIANSPAMPLIAESLLSLVRGLSADQYERLSRACPGLYLS